MPMQPQTQSTQAQLLAASHLQKLDRNELKMLEGLTKENTAMRRKMSNVDGNEPRPKTRFPIKVYVKDPNEIIDMRKKIKEFDKKEEMYKSRISELEQQVSTFSMFHILNNPAVKEMNDESNKNYESYKKALPIPPTKSSLIGGHLIKKPLVEEKDDSNETFKLTKKNRTKLLALYEFVPTPAQLEKGRLAFKEGEVLNLIRKSRGGWWVAESKGRIGKIPSNYIEELDPNSSTRVRVAKGFEAQQSGDIPLRRGDTVVILKRQDNGWCLGESDGKIGFFPNECVKELQPPFC
jgi:hypothetical protein